MPIVKRYKANHPTTEPGGWEIVTTKVHLNSDSGHFEIELPEHVSDVIRSLKLPDRYNIHDHHGKPPKGTHSPVFAGRRVVARDMQTVMDVFGSICQIYGIWIQDNAAERWIMVIFAYNVKWVEGFHNAEGVPSRQFAGCNGGKPSSMSFAGVPALELTTSDVWKIDGAFFTKSRGGRWHSVQERQPGKIHYLLWTQEREDFLARMDHGLTSMICKLIEFFEDLEGNMTTAIETGTNALQIDQSK